MGEAFYEGARALADKSVQRPAPEGASGPGGRRHKAGWSPYSLDFPANCPIEPIGVYGDLYFFLDSKRHLQTVRGSEFKPKHVQSMLGEFQEYKCEAWPRWKKPDEDGRIVCDGWRPEWAIDVLMAEAARRGVWNAEGRLRGPGCWRDDDGHTLVMHCGDTVFLGAAPLSPGKIGGYVYHADSARPKPLMTYGENKIGLEILDILNGWAWSRPGIDPILMLGWIGAAILGGALDWRPLVWITGDKATGKSTLQRLVRGLMGDDSVIASSDSTAAGVWQRVGHMSLPVALDELEASTNNAKAQGIISLARQAGSGDQMLRGGASHSGSSFTVRNCFMFSSILIPPLLGQDISRMAVLSLNTLPKDSIPPAFDRAWLAGAAVKLRGRLVKNWVLLDERIAAAKEVLARFGHGGRGGDQFGTLLACASLLVHDEDPGEDVFSAWGALLDRRGDGDEEADHERCLSHLLSSLVDVYRGGARRTVADWIKQAAGFDRQRTDAEEAREALGNMGIGFLEKKDAEGVPFKLVLVANDHQGLAALFRGTHWMGQSGSDGVWAQALCRVNGAIRDRQRFNGMRKYCTAIPLASLFGEER